MYLWLILRSFTALSKFQGLINKTSWIKLPLQYQQKLSLNVYTVFKHKKKSLKDTRSWGGGYILVKLKSIDPKIKCLKTYQSLKTLGYYDLVFFNLFTNHQDQDKTFSTFIDQYMGLWLILRSFAALSKFQGLITKTSWIKLPLQYQQKPSFHIYTLFLS